MKMAIVMRPIWFVVLASLLSSCGIQPPTPPPLPVQIVTARDSLAARDLWPEFAASEFALAIVHDSTTWVFGHPDPGDGYEPVDAVEGAFVREGRDDRVAAHSTVDWDGTVTTTMLLDATDPDSVNGWAAIALHEAFHAFTSDRASWQPNEAVVFEYPYEDPGLLALSMLETQSLLLAARELRKGDVEEAVRHAGHAVLAREEFRSAAPEFAVAYGEQTELHEGLAFYVEQQARNQTADLMFARATWLNANDTRRRAYYNGAAKAFLLDDWLPDWKARVDRQTGPEIRPSLTNLLRSAVVRNGGMPEAIPDDFRNEYSRRASSRVQAYVRQMEGMLENWVRRPGYRVIVEASSEPMFTVGFDPMNLLRLPDNRLFHDRWLSLTHRKGTITTLDQLVLTAPAGSHPIFQGLRRFEIVGLQEPPAVEESGDSTHVRWTGGALHVRDARVREEGQTLILTL